MSYTFGDASQSSGYTLGSTDSGFNYGGSSDYGFDLGFDLAVQDYSADDFVYAPTAAPQSGWDSALTKITDTVGGVVDMAGGWFDQYVGKVIDKEVFGSDWYNQQSKNQETVTPVNTTAPAQAGFAFDKNTMMIGAAVVVGLILISRK